MNGFVVDNKSALATICDVLQLPGIWYRNHYDDSYSLVYDSRYTIKVLSQPIARIMYHDLSYLYYVKQQKDLLDMWTGKTESVVWC